VTDHVEKR